MVGERCRTYDILSYRPTVPESRCCVLYGSATESVFTGPQLGCTVSLVETGGQLWVLCGPKNVMSGH